MINSENNAHELFLGGPKLSQCLLLACLPEDAYNYHKRRPNLEPTHRAIMTKIISKQDNNRITHKQKNTSTGKSDETFPRKRRMPHLTCRRITSNDQSSDCVTNIYSSYRRINFHYSHVECLALLHALSLCNTLQLHARSFKKAWTQC